LIFFRDTIGKSLFVVIRALQILQLFIAANRYVILDRFVLCVSSGKNPNFRRCFDALDNFCAFDDPVATGNGFVIHVGRIYPHPSNFGHRNGIDPHHPGPKPHLVCSHIQAAKVCSRESRWMVPC
jgi:hypothetical protein